MINPNNVPEFPVGKISNYYGGGLTLKVDGGKAYWSIKDYGGGEWEEIPDYLYAALVKFSEKTNDLHNPTTAGDE